MYKNSIEGYSQPVSNRRQRRTATSSRTEKDCRLVHFVRTAWKCIRCFPPSLWFRVFFAIRGVALRYSVIGKPWRLLPALTKKTWSTLFLKLKYVWITHRLLQWNNQKFHPIRTHVQECEQICSSYQSTDSNFNSESSLPVNHSEQTFLLSLLSFTGKQLLLQGLTLRTAILSFAFTYFAKSRPHECKQVKNFTQLVFVCF